MILILFRIFIYRNNNENVCTQKIDPSKAHSFGNHLKFRHAYGFASLP
jgi:hypothetical protein